MSTLFLILKTIFLLVGIVYTFSNVVKAFRGKYISALTIWVMAIGITGYLLIEFWLGY